MSKKKELTIVTKVEITTIVPLTAKANPDAEATKAIETLKASLNGLHLADDVNVLSTKVFQKD